MERNPQVLQTAVQRKKNMTMILVNGFYIKGTTIGDDVYSILLEVDGKQQLVYKHAISTKRNRSMNLDDLMLL
ncbi:RNA chaperone Hfq [Bacillus cereus]|uniref:RNA chaperone Hfq n=1 Tax=Bacillus cereus TaxID=1396 RepID=UPI0021189F8B|nr:RNA chaperone Hfq [Bacillus cereus]